MIIIGIVTAIIFVRLFMVFRILSCFSDIFLISSLNSSMLFAESSSDFFPTFGLGSAVLSKNGKLAY